MYKYSNNYNNYKNTSVLSLNTKLMLAIYVVKWTNSVCTISPFRVWRYRGGRDGHETLQQFMSFIGNSATKQTMALTQNKKKHQLYPGVAIFIVPSSLRVGFKLNTDSDLGVS